MDYPNVCIILVNWNGRDDTLACLESIRHIAYPNFEVVIIDNGSSDDSVQAIQGTFPDVTVLETGENLGFAGGNNVGMRYALEQGSDYLFLLNNDTIVDPQILNSFMEAATRIGKEAILGAKIYYYSEPNRIWYAGARWDNGISHFLHTGQGAIDDGREFGVLTETDYASGCALFVSRKLLEGVGMLDEEFFLTFEETDLCYRARKAGYKSYFVPEAKVWHKVSTSFGGENSPLFSYFLTRNRLLWAKKNLSFGKRLVMHHRVFYELLRYFLPPRICLTNSDGRRNVGAIYSALVEYKKEFKNAFRKKFDSPFKKAKLWAVRDYFLGRFGDCPDTVRLLSRRRSGS